MRIQPRRFLLDESVALHRTIRFGCSLDGIKLGEGKRLTVMITRTSRFTNPRYGTFDFTALVLETMVRNFDAKTYGHDIFIDVANHPENGAAAKALALCV